jgi:hypothetical protein
MGLQELNDHWVLSIVKRSSAPSVTRAHVAALSDEVLDNFKVTSCRSKMKACTSIVVSLIEVKALDMQSDD